MVQLQRNFTNREQSGRLLALGVPADSADFYMISTEIPCYILNGVFSDWLDVHKKLGSDSRFVPCWSAGRLIEIFQIVSTKSNIVIEHHYNIDKLIDCIPDGNMDFSKLEE